VGRALCEHLQAHGIKVRRALRRPPAGDVGEHVVVGEIGPHTDWREALDGIDAVAHLAARVHVMQDCAPDPAAEYRKVNVEGTRTLTLSAGRARVRRVLLLSSVKVNGEAALHPYTEDQAPKPDDRYAVSKLEAEQVLQEVATKVGVEWTILRPPLVYGPGVGANFLRLLQAVAHRRPLPIAAVANLRSLIYVGNLVDAIRVCLEHPGAANETFLVRDGEDVSTPELARRMAQALGVAPLLVPVPCSLLRFMGRLLGREATVRRLAGSLRVDDARVRANVGWRPPFALDEGLQATANWYRGLDRGV
jgi:nucleoside-diphosphate-sugar epimerase